MVAGTVFELFGTGKLPNCGNSLLNVPLPWSWNTTARDRHAGRIHSGEQAYPRNDGTVGFPNGYTFSSFMAHHQFIMRYEKNLAAAGRPAPLAGPLGWVWIVDC